ncbi:MAG: hypothetical protein KGZ69_06050, partial [Methylomonas sp.]|nr:hypothetical protein [Methylomonas sp.]
RSLWLVVIDNSGREAMRVGSIAFAADKGSAETRTSATEMIEDERAGINPSLEGHIPVECRYRGRVTVVKKNVRRPHAFRTRFGPGAPA